MTNMTMLGCCRAVVQQMACCRQHTVDQGTIVYGWSQLGSIQCLMSTQQLSAAGSTVSCAPQGAAALTVTGPCTGCTLDSSTSISLTCVASKHYPHMAKS